MTYAEFTDVFYLCLSAGLVVFTLDHMYRLTKADQHRESLFTLRDELFDYMWKNGHSFDLMAYRLLREHLNRAIRVADVASPLAFSVMVLVARTYSPAENRLNTAINAVEDAAVRAQLTRTLDESVQSWWVYMGVFWTITKYVLAYQERIAHEATENAVEAGNIPGVFRDALAGLARPRLRLRLPL
ncbi:MAG: hypothetical protein OXQ29_03335 [Rhodospirillaceae bacterium]|nr:hypothetical protein [Rhodospirillaceae bacterium]